MNRSRGWLNERLAVRANPRFAGDGGTALLLDQERRSGVHHHGERVRHPEGTYDAFLRADRQVHQPEERALSAVRVGKDNAGSAVGVRESAQQVSLRGLKAESPQQVQDDDAAVRRGAVLKEV